VGARDIIVMVMMALMVPIGGVAKYTGGGSLAQLRVFVVAWLWYVPLLRWVQRAMLAWANWDNLERPPGVLLCQRKRAPRPVLYQYRCQFLARTLLGADTARTAESRHDTTTIPRYHRRTPSRMCACRSQSWPQHTQAR
jgi:hypothetical protein